MGLDMLDIKEIQSYFSICERIKELKCHESYLSEAFYNQSMATRTMPGDTEIISVGFSPDRNVVPFLDVITNISTRIKRLEKMKRYLDDYLNTLDHADKNYLINRYSNEYVFGSHGQIDIELHNEIKQINEAISYMFGYDDLFIDDVEEETATDNVSMIAEALGV